MALLDKIKALEPDKKKNPFLHTVYDGFFTFLYQPATVTKGGVHVKDGIDLKRTMAMVVLALQLCYVFGTYNIGQQHFIALGQHTGFFEAIHLKILFGLVKIIPIWVVTHVVGLGVEFYFAYKKGHGIEEGFLVSGALIPLIMPPDIPLWILAIAVAFSVLFAKEAFGGTGMNIWNVALVARVFIFFAYPGEISGSNSWVAGLDYSGGHIVTDFKSSGWVLHLFDKLWGALGWTTFGHDGVNIDGFSGATPLALAASGGWPAVTAQFSTDQMWWGSIPGSIGETSKPLIIVGALMLIGMGIASWRIMVSMVIGCALTAILFNAWGFNAFMNVPWIYHFYMGSFLFAMAFMATDPVTAAATNRGKWYYGFGIGVFGMIVRVINPAYPEGWMLAILFMNSIAPLIDYFILESNMKKRLSRA
ncbi:MAG: NADH:ubiquinone reductase (Na(+)-transporting) subunit B [Saprospiraceae bacterium]